MKLAIYGSGGLGREALELAKQINNDSQKWSEIIFIDDITHKNVQDGHKIVPFEKALNLYKVDEIEFIVAVGEPEFRKMLWNKIVDKGYKLATLIHPKVFIPESTNILSGTVVSCDVFISCGNEIGENVYIQPKASIGHDCKISSHCVISSFVSFAGNCSVEECTFIGMSVPIKEKSKIGSHTIVGMGSVVLRDIPDNAIAIGNPARVMKMNEDKRVFH